MKLTDHLKFTVVGELGALRPLDPPAIVVDGEDPLPRQDLLQVQHGASELPTAPQPSYWRALLLLLLEEQVGNAVTPGTVGRVLLATLVPVG